MLKSKTVSEANIQIIMSSKKELSSRDQIRHVRARRKNESQVGRLINKYLENKRETVGRVRHVNSEYILKKFASEISN